MIANARMYGVTREVALLWRDLLTAVVAATGLDIELLDHPAPAPLDDLWCRSDMGAVFMCGLPFSRAAPQPVLVAAPVPSPPAFGGEARYWSEFVVRRDSGFQSVADTLGHRIAFTVPDSQSGCVAALTYLSALHPADTAGGDRGPLYAEIIAPTITPQGALESVIRGAADIAPIDSYAFALVAAHRPELAAEVRVVGRTAPTPIPVLVASHPGAEAEALSAAFVAAHADAKSAPLMQRLLLQRFVRPAAGSYDRLRNEFTTATRFWRAHSLAVVSHPAFTW
jgi:ABC-type phosphate/phosphonate transport system substrate-binding protein